VETTIYILDSPRAKASPLLGRVECVKLGLVQWNRIVFILATLTLGNVYQKYSNIFDGSKIKLPFTYHMKLKNNTLPIMEPVRRVPFTLKNKLKSVLTEMEEQVDIVKVDEPTEWVLPHVNVKKKEKLKVVMDTRKLNQYVICEMYRMPTIEDIASRLSRAKYFTVLDAPHAFAPIPVDAETSQKLILETLFGQYCYLTLQYELYCSLEVLQ